MDRLEPVAQQAFEALESLAILERQAFERAADDLALGLRDGLAGLPAELAHPGRHVAGLEEFGPIGVDQRAEGLGLFGQAGQVVVGELFALGRPRCGGIPARATGP